MLERISAIYCGLTASKPRSLDGKFTVFDVGLLYRVALHDSTIGSP
jgi:hypothetical protein